MPSLFDGPYEGDDDDDGDDVDGDGLHTFHLYCWSRYWYFDWVVVDIHWVVHRPS